jgi:hypothetical protein
MDPWKQVLVMPQLAGKELLVAGMAQWLHFKPHIESHFCGQVELHTNQSKDWVTWA